MASRVHVFTFGEAMLRFMPQPSATTLPEYNYRQEAPVNTF